MTQCNNKIIKLYIPNSILSPGGVRSTSVQVKIAGTNCCGSSNIVSIPVPPQPPPTTPEPEICLPYGLDLYGYTATVSYDAINCGGGHACNRAIFDLYIDDLFVGRADLNNADDGGYRESVFTINEHIEISNSTTLKLQCVLDNCHRGIGKVSIKDVNDNTVFSSCLPNDVLVLGSDILCAPS